MVGCWPCPELVGRTWVDVQTETKKGIMKTQQFTTVVLTGVMLFVSLAAQAFYNPSTGRWLSRDPIEEEGGKNMNGFVANTPINNADHLGLVIVGFYGADISYWWPNGGNQFLEELSEIMEENEKVLRPSSKWRTYPLYESRADSQALFDLLQYLDTNKDGYYNPGCGDDYESIKIFGWSWGGASAVELANRIKDSDKFKAKNIGLVAVIDPVTAFRTGKHTVPSNVYRFWNRYQLHGRNVLPVGLPNHGDKLKVDDPSYTIADQSQLDPNGRDDSIDHVSILGRVAFDFLFQFRR